MDPVVRTGDFARESFFGGFGVMKMAAPLPGPTTGAGLNMIFDDHYPFRAIKKRRAPNLPQSRPARAAHRFSPVQEMLPRPVAALSHVAVAQISCCLDEFDGFERGRVLGLERLQKLRALSPIQGHTL